VSQDSLTAALTELRASLERFQDQLAAKDAEIRQLREALSEREARIRALGEQALHLLDLLHESRAELATRKAPA
jgi:chromosome segregation ATPase